MPDERGHRSVREILEMQHVQQDTQWQTPQPPETPTVDRWIRQEGLEINRYQRVAVIGCGGIGSWLGLYLGLAGVAKIHLYDGDNVEIHNLNRLPFSPKAVGTMKSLALADLIRELVPDEAVTVQAHGNWEPELHPLGGFHYVAVTTDSARSRRAVAEHCAALGVTYIEAGAEGDTAHVSPSPGDWETEREAHPGYQHVPVTVVPCTWAASVAAGYVLRGVRCTTIHRMSWGEAAQGSPRIYMKSIEEGNNG